MAMSEKNIIQINRMRFKTQSRYSTQSRNGFSKNKSLRCAHCTDPTAISELLMENNLSTYSLILIGYSCIDTYSYSCFNRLSNERKSMFKSGDSCAVLTWVNIENT